MKHRAFLFGTAWIVLLLFPFNEIAAQDLEAGDVLPELTVEERAQRATGNFTAMTLVFLSYAKEHGQRAAELGRRAGERFADSWPEELTPAAFVRGMHNNFQMYGVTTEILEASDGVVRAQRTRGVLEKEFESRSTLYGATLDEFETFLEHVQKGIAAERGLTYSETVDGDHVVFTVSASR